MTRHRRRPARPRIAAASGDSPRRSLANLLPGQLYYAPGRLSAGDRLPQAERRASTATQRRERFGQACLPAVFSRAWLARCLAELGDVRRGHALGEEGAADCRGGRSPGSLHDAYRRSACCTCAKATCPGLPLLERAWASARTRTFRSMFPCSRYGLGRMPTPWPGASPRPCRCSSRPWSRLRRRAGVCIRRSASRPGRGVSAGRPPGGGTRSSPSAPWRTPVSTRNGATRRMRCGSSARSPRSRSPGGRAGRSSLPPGPRPGRGTRHAPAPGPLPPRPRHAVCPDRPAGAGPRRAVDGHRDVPRDGDDLLAAQRRRRRWRRWRSADGLLLRARTGHAPCSNAEQRVILSGAAAAI